MLRNKPIPIINAPLVRHLRETQLGKKSLSSLMSTRNVSRRSVALSPHTSHERQGFQARAGMLPGRATPAKLPGKDASTALQQGGVWRAPRTPLGTIPETVWKGIITAQNPQQRMACTLAQHLLPLLALLWRVLSMHRIPSTHWKVENELLL